jgi:hypothetical protein
MDTKLTDDGFFWMRDGVLSPEFCEGLIAKFEECPDKGPGQTLSGYNPKSKTTTDLMLSGREDFREEDETLYLALTLNVRDYFDQLQYRPWKGPFDDTGYNMQRTLPGEFFNWHTDFYADPWANLVRVFTFIWYLNDVPGEGVYTEFCNGVRVEPKAGRMVVFPSDFANMHRGVSPETSTKYIVTGWMHQPLDPEFTPAGRQP